MKPLCFVLMPFGKKAAGGKNVIDFDAVYRQVIRPAIVAADLEPLRADEEAGGGIIHKPMFERLVLCEFALADLTTANANVFYELGVRHAAKERTTVLLFAEGHGRLPFDVAQLRAYPYSIGRNGKPNKVERDQAALSDRLRSAIGNSDKDSPLYQLLDDYPDIDHAKTDVFRERVQIEEATKGSLAEAREIGATAVRKIELEQGRIQNASAGVAIDLLLSYRAVGSWSDMTRLFLELDPVLQKTALVREQYGFALNRSGERARSKKVLSDLIDERGPSSETNGILGRVHKDDWQDAVARGDQHAAEGHLRQAIKTYIAGFEDDWRDAYPGINALTLLRIAGRDEEYAELRQVVGYAVTRKMAAGEIDYWDLATILELAVLDRSETDARRVLPDALIAIREKWEAASTADNLRLLATYMPAEAPWIKEIVNALITAKEK